MSNRTLPQQIRDARTLARLSQEDLAKRVGVSRQAVSYWENGGQVPTDANLAALRYVLGSAFGTETDAMFSTLQRLHGQSLELEALNRYLLERQAAFSAALAEATQPSMDAETAAMIAAADGPITPSVPAGAPRVRRRNTGTR